VALSSTSNGTLKVATVVQQIITKLSEAVSERDKIMVIVKMSARVHRTLSVVAFNANGILRRRYELSKQLQDLHRDTSQTPWEVLHSKLSLLSGWSLPGKKRNSHNHVDLCCMWDMYIWQRQRLFIRDKPDLSSDMLHKDYGRKGSIVKKNLWSWVSRGLAPRRTDGR
jgi:hypothetical protein